MSRYTPITSFSLKGVPYLVPEELLLCLNSPLYNAQPLGPSQKASSTLVSGLATPSFMSLPLVMTASK